MINVLSKVSLLNVNSTCPPPCLILYQHYVHNISTLHNTLPQDSALRGAPHNKPVSDIILFLIAKTWISRPFPCQQAILGQT